MPARRANIFECDTESSSRVTTGRKATKKALVDAKPGKVATVAIAPVRKNAKKGKDGCSAPKGRTARKPRAAAQRKTQEFCSSSQRSMRGKKTLEDEVLAIVTPKRGKKQQRDTDSSSRKRPAKRRPSTEELEQSCKRPCQATASSPRKVRTAKKKTAKSAVKRNADGKPGFPGGPYNELIVEPTAPHQWTLIYLHGFEGHGREFFEAHIEDLPQLEQFGIRVVCPTAWKRPITMMEGELVRGWYDYTTDYESVREDPPCMTTLAETVELLTAIVDREVNLLQGDTSRLLIGGCSQGAITSMNLLHSLNIEPAAYLGIAGVYSTVPLKNMNVPMFILGGSKDEIHQWEWVEPTVRRIQNRANQCVVRNYVADHVDLCSDGSRSLMAAFLQTVCSGEAGSFREEDFDRVVAAEAKGCRDFRPWTKEVTY